MLWPINVGHPKIGQHFAAWFVATSSVSVREPTFIGKEILRKNYLKYYVANDTTLSITLVGQKLGANKCSYLKNHCNQPNFRTTFTVNENFGENFGQKLCCLHTT